MTKDHVVKEIRRTAVANGGVALGWKRFRTETGIAYHDWYGKFGCGWNDLVREAGFEGNRFDTDGYSEDELIEALIALTRRLTRVPVRADLIYAKLQDENFPSEKAIRRLGGTKYARAARVIRYCESTGKNDDVLPLWRQMASTAQSEADDSLSGQSERKNGYVYLVKHGARSEYKIGKTFNPLRREGEIAIELPEKLAPIHYIETDDPAGVESYWHNRFAQKRKAGEWFALSQDDVRAFKRWRRIA